MLIAIIELSSGAFFWSQIWAFFGLLRGDNNRWWLKYGSFFILQFVFFSVVAIATGAFHSLVIG